jgi:RNA polymerase sigma-54 factor
MQLKVTPKQIAANYILQMSSAELIEAIAEELDENPALEMTELRACPLCGSRIAGNYCISCFPRTAAGEQRVVDDLPGERSQPLLRDDGEEFDPITRAEAGETLEDHLIWSMRVALPRHLHAIADYVIGALDEHGFLTASNAEIINATGASSEDLEEVLTTLRAQEPPGIGARNTTECLLAQLQHLRENGEPVLDLVEPIVKRYLSDLGGRRFREIARKLHVDKGEVIRAWEFIKTHLNPYPASAFASAADARRAAVRPDVIIRNVDGELQVEIVESHKFNLHVDSLYSRLARELRNSEASEAERDHVREYVNRARFFIDNVNRRRATIERIAQSLIERQGEYLLNGVQHLVPLTRAEVGNIIGMHESTVSRATAGKFVLIPSGEVVPFSHFFTASLGVKDQIKKMIEGEDPHHPYSDADIAELLAEEGVTLARRTVAKYRDELHIAPARLRHPAA